MCLQTMVPFHVWRTVHTKVYIAPRRQYSNQVCPTLSVAMSELGQNAKNSH